MMCRILNLIVLLTITTFVNAQEPLLSQLGTYWVYSIHPDAFDHNNKINQKNIAQYLQFVDTTTDLNRLNKKLSNGIYYYSRVAPPYQNVVVEENIYNVTDLHVSFVKSEEGVLMIVRNANGQMVKNAQLFAAKKQLPYDDEKNAFVIPSGKEHVQLKYDDQQLFYSVKSFFWNQRENASYVSKMFWASSKPIYKVGDTLKVKFFNKKMMRFDRRNKPVKIELSSRGIWGKDTSFYIKSYRPGFYEFSFPLQDWDFKLDNDIWIWAENKKIYFSHAIPYEQYELKDMMLSESLNQSIFHAEDSVILKVNVSDNNQHTLYDAKVDAILSFETVQSPKIETGLLSIRKEIWSGTLLLEPDGNYYLRMPVTDLPAVAGRYKIEITATASNQLTKKSTLEFSTDYQLNFKVENSGSQQVIIKPLNESKLSGKYDLLFLDDQYNSLKSQPLVVHQPVKFPSGAAYVKVQSVEGKSFLLSLDALFPPEIVIDQNPSDIRITAAYSQPFWYSITKNDKVIASGYKKELNQHFVSKPTDAFEVNVYYLYENKWLQVSKTSRVYNNYNIEITAPLKATPGQEVNTVLTVKDQKGNPVKDLDITASGIKNSFDRNNMPVFNVYPSSSKAVRMYRIENVVNDQKIKDHGKLAAFKRSPLAQFFANDSTYVYVEDAVTEKEQLLFFYKGKDDLLAVTKNNIPLHATVNGNHAIIPADYLREKDSLLVITTKKSFYIYDVSVPKGKRKIFMVNEKSLYANDKLVKKNEEKVSFVPGYFDVEKPQSRIAQTFLNIDDYFIPFTWYFHKFQIHQLWSNRYSLHIHRLFSQNFVPKVSSSFFVDKGYVYEKADAATRLTSDKTNPFVALSSVIYGRGDLDSLHVSALLNDASRYSSRQQLFLDDRMESQLRYVLVREKDTLNVYHPEAIPLKKNSRPVVYYYYDFNKILIDSFEINEDIVIRRIDKNIIPADSLQRAQLFSMLENSTGFERLKLAYSNEWASPNYRKLLVIDENGRPVPYASVMVDVRTGTQTNNEGIATISPTSSSYVTVTALGYEPVKHYLRSNENIIVLKRAGMNLDEVVVTGYGVNFSGELQGRIAGVQISSRQQNSVRIRGASSLRSDRDGDGNLSAFISDKKNTLETNYTDIALLQEKEISYYLPRVRTDFKDESFWSPAARTDGNGTATISYHLPDDITSWKNQFLITDGKKHFYTKTLPLRVYLPVFAELEHPKFLTTKDYFQYTTKVRQVEDSAMLKVQEEILLNDKLITERTSEMTKLLSDKHYYQTNTEDSLNIEYKVSVDNKLTDAMQKKIPVYPVGTEVSDHQYHKLMKDTVITIANPDKDLYLAIQNNYPSILNDRINYLVNYYYNCNEQMASKLIGLLWKQKLYQEKNIRFKEEAHIKSLIRQLLQNQNDEGAWSWFNRTSSLEWITDHVTEALKMANANGYEIAPEVFTKIRSAAANWKNDNKKDRIIALKILETLSSEASVQGGYDERSVYHTIVFSSIFKQSLDSVISRITETASMAYYPTFNYYVLDNHIMVNIELYKYLEKMKHPLAEKVFNYLHDNLMSKNYLNTYQLSSLFNVLMPKLLPMFTNSEENKLLVNGEELKFNEEGYYTKKFTESDSVQLRFQGTSPVYVSYYTKRWEVIDTAVSKGYTVHTNWVSATRTGEKVVLKVNVKVDRPADYVMLEIPIPAGLDYAEKPAARYNEYFRSYYDHQVVIFYEHLRAGSFEIEIPMIARYEGNYYINPGKISQQYFPAFYGATGVKQVRVENK